jgi:hypothetical protein
MEKIKLTQLYFCYKEKWQSDKEFITEIKKIEVSKCPKWTLHHTICYEPNKCINLKPLKYVYISMYENLGKQNNISKSHLEIVYPHFR